MQPILQCPKRAVECRHPGSGKPFTIGNCHSKLEQTHPAHPEVHKCPDRLVSGEMVPYILCKAGGSILDNQLRAHPGTLTRDYLVVQLQHRPLPSISKHTSSINNCPAGQIFLCAGVSVNTHTTSPYGGQPVS